MKYIDRINLVRFLGGVALLLLSFSAYAEVMDKEPGLIENWAWGVIGGVLCFLAARYKPWLLVVVFPLPAIHFISLISEIENPHVGLSIRIEAGPVYIYTAYGLAVFLVVCVIFGVLMRSRALQAGKLRP